MKRETAMAVARVLCVEDNPANLRLIQRLMNRLPGVSLLDAPCGRFGVDRARTERPDLILLDINLPDIDGHEVCRHLRNHPETAAIPVVAVSANVMPQDIDKARRTGFDDYLTKPLDIKRFYEVVHRFLSRKPAE
jgi:CheY-like chemotaxis protein